MMARVGTSMVAACRKSRTIALLRVPSYIDDKRHVWIIGAIPCQRCWRMGHEGQSGKDGGEPPAHLGLGQPALSREGLRCRHRGGGHEGGGVDPWRLLRSFRIQGRPHSQGAHLHAGCAFWQRTRSRRRSEENTSELQSLMRTSYDVFCLKKKLNSIHNI